MGFRPPLDLSEILPLYQRWIDLGTAGVRVVEDKPVVEERYEPIPSRLYGSPQSVDDPVRVGSGPVVCSTSTVLDLSPSICWDVNGYYRSLGVHWRATRRELMAGYCAVNGQHSVYLTYVLKQLLDKAVRRAYDLTPLGHPFLDDMYVQEAMKRRASQEAGRRSSQGNTISFKDILGEWGFNFEAEESLAEQGETNDDDPLDSDRSNRSNSDLSDPPRSFGDWAYSHYLLRTSTVDVDRMQMWQAALITALAERREVRKVGVGIAGKTPHRYLVANISGDDVIFLSEAEQPTEELAGLAAAALIDTH